MQYKFGPTSALIQAGTPLLQDMRRLDIIPGKVNDK
jgi:hypothetical protein